MLAGSGFRRTGWLRWSICKHRLVWHLSETDLGVFAGERFYGENPNASVGIFLPDEAAAVPAFQRGRWDQALTLLLAEFRGDTLASRRPGGEQTRPLGRGRGQRLSGEPLPIASPQIWVLFSIKAVGQGCSQTERPGYFGKLLSHTPLLLCVHVSV